MNSKQQKIYHLPIWNKSSELSEINQQCSLSILILLITSPNIECKYLPLSSYLFRIPPLFPTEVSRRKMREFPLIVAECSLTPTTIATICTKVSLDFELNRATAATLQTESNTRAIPPLYVHARILNARCARGIVHT